MFHQDVVNMNEIELRHLRYFIAVAEELHFGRAALRLHMAQPPLSQQIRKLEEWVGHPLFARTSRSVRLTPAGSELLKRLQQTFRKLENDVRAARQIGRGEVGALDVGFVGSAMLTTIPQLLSRYRKLYPDVRLRLQEYPTSALVAVLQEGSLDVGFLRDPEFATGLSFEKVISEPFVAVVPASHRLATKKSISVAALRNEPFVFFSRSFGQGAWHKTVALCEEHGFQPNIVQETPQWLTTLRLVGAGIGVTIAPKCVAEIATGEVVCLPLQKVSSRSYIELAFQTNHACPIANAFLNLARTTFDQA